MQPTPELAPRPVERGVLGHASVLWSQAPAWRRLTVGACTLTLVTCVLSMSDILIARDPSVPAPPSQQPRLLAAPTSQSNAEGMPAASCSLPNGQIFLSGAGTVVGFLSPQQASDLLQKTQVQLHANINPLFLTNLRAQIDTPSGRVIALVPTTMTVRPGDQVQFSGAHRDFSLPCHYVPNLINGFIKTGGQ
jgi:hypothetical protein